jgi:hypothetical protein
MSILIGIPKYSKIYRPFEEDLLGSTNCLRMRYAR